MSPTETLLLATALLSCALVADSSCLSWLLKSNAFVETNALLVGRTKSEDLLTNIQVAREILESGDGLPNDEDVEHILRQLVALQPIVEQAQEALYECSSENMALMRDIDTSMRDLSRRDAYTEPMSRNRLNRLILKLQEYFGDACLALLDAKYESKKKELDGKRFETLAAFSDLLEPSIFDLGAQHGLQVFNSALNGDHLKRTTNLGLYDRMRWARVFANLHNIHHETRAIRTLDPETGELHVSRAKLVDLYDEMVTKSCDYFVDEHKDVAEIFEKTIELGRSVRLNNAIWPQIYDRMSLALTKVAAGYQVCKDLRGVDHNRVIEALLKHINWCEDEYL